MEESKQVCYDDVPIATWVYVYCGINLAAGFLVAPFFFCPGIKTAIYAAVLNVLLAPTNIGILIWGATFFWTSKMTDECVRLNFSFIRIFLF